MCRNTTKELRKPVRTYCRLHNDINGVLWDSEIMLVEVSTQLPVFDCTLLCKVLCGLIIRKVEDKFIVLHSSTVRWKYILLLPITSFVKMFTGLRRIGHGSAAAVRHWRWLVLRPLENMMRFRKVLLRKVTARYRYCSWLTHSPFLQGRSVWGLGFRPSWTRVQVKEGLTRANA